MQGLKTRDGFVILKAGQVCDGRTPNNAGGQGSRPTQSPEAGNNLNGKARPFDQEHWQQQASSRIDREKLIRDGGAQESKDPR